MCGGWGERGVGSSACFRVGPAELAEPHEVSFFPHFGCPLFAEYMAACALYSQGIPPTPAFAHHRKTVAVLFMC